MAEIWFISDTHFGHANILTFRSPDGSLMRPFSSWEEMDNTMIERWNKVVKPGDHVYHMGDVAMRREHLQTVKALAGKLRLLFGNHDIYDYKSYTEVGFKKFYGTRVLDDIIFSHIPLHPMSVPRWAHGNAHGHVHTNGGPTGPYLNLSVEVIDYTPVPLYMVKERLKKMKESVNG